MGKKAKKRHIAETESNNEGQNGKNKKSVDTDSPKKRKIVSEDVPNKKEKATNLSKDLREENSVTHKLKKKKDKKNKKHEKVDGIKQDAQSESKKKKKSKKDKKREKNNSVELKNQDKEDTNKLKNESKKIDAIESSETKKKHDKFEAKKNQNQNADSPRNFDKKENKKYRKRKKALEKLQANSEISEKTVISTKRKAKYKLKREESRKQRKLIRQEEGQFSSINKLSLEEMKQKIAEIESRESLSNSALRKLRTLKKKVQVEEGNADNIKSQKRKSDELDDHNENNNNKKIKREELNDRGKSIDLPLKNKKKGSPKKSKNAEHNSLNDEKKSIDSPLKNKKEGTPKKSKNVEDNSSITKKQLFIEDRIGSVTNEDKQEKQQKTQINKDLFKKVDSPQKKHEKLEDIKSKTDGKNRNSNFKKQFKRELEEYDSKSDVELNNKHNDIEEKYTKKSSNVFKNKNVITGKSKEIKVDNADYEDGSYNHSDQIQSSSNNLIKNLPKNVHAKKVEIKKNKSPELKIVNKKKLIGKTITHSDNEEGKFEENDSKDNSYSKLKDTSLNKEIKAHNNRSPKSSYNQKKNKKAFEHKSSDTEEGELKDSDSEDNISFKIEMNASNKESLKNDQKRCNVKKDELEESDSENSYIDQNDSEENDNSESNDSSFEEEQMIKKKESDKEDGELEESLSDNKKKSQSDRTLNNLPAKRILNQKENLNHVNDNSAKKQRYVLFLGNLAYETTTVDLKKHFLTKVTKVKDIRIPLDSKTRRPRGFGYIEVENSEDYEKALSLHGTFVKGRPMKIQYTASGSKKAGNRKEIIHKNKKLHALRKAGKLAGSKKDSHKRSFRRNLNKEKTQT